MPAKTVIIGSRLLRNTCRVITTRRSPLVAPSVRNPCRGYPASAPLPAGVERYAKLPVRKTDQRQGDMPEKIIRILKPTSSMPYSWRRLDTGNQSKTDSGLRTPPEHVAHPDDRQ